MAFFVRGHFYLEKTGAESVAALNRPQTFGAIRPPETGTDDNIYLFGSQENFAVRQKLLLAKAVIMSLWQPHGLGARLCAGVFYRFYPTAANASVSMPIMRMCDSIAAERILSTHSDRYSQHPPHIECSYRYRFVARRHTHQSLPTLVLRSQA